MPHRGRLRGSRPAAHIDVPGSGLAGDGDAKVVRVAVRRLSVQPGDLQSLLGSQAARFGLCHSSRRHNDFSPWSDDYQPGRHGSTETTHCGGRLAPACFLATSHASPETSSAVAMLPAKGNKQNDVRLKAKWLAQPAKWCARPGKMMCAAGKMMCAPFRA